jgi:hypothetical protein
MSRNDATTRNAMVRRSPITTPSEPTCE